MGMKKLTWPKIVTLVAAMALGSACVANDALAHGDGYGWGQLGGYPGYYDGSGQDFGAYVEPPYSGYYAEGKQDFDEDVYVEPTYPGLYGFYPSYRPYSSTR